MTSTLETLRQTAEDVETLKHLATAALQTTTSAPNPHPRLAPHPHPLPTPLHASQLTRSLIQLAAQKSFHLSTSLPSLPSSPTFPTEEALSNFYANLRELRETHRHNPSQPIPSQSDRDAALLAAAPSPAPFSGAEGHGHYLDLQPHYLAYLNAARGAPHVEYYEYVQETSTKFKAVPASARASRKYEAYLENLLEYLVGFARRAHPLHRIDEHVEEARKKIRDGVTERLKEISDGVAGPEAVLEALGADGVKKELLSIGMKCGGRPLERAIRLLEAARAERFGERVVTEGVLRFVLETLLKTERDATVANVRKKLSLSYAELEAERVAEEAVLEGGGIGLGEEEDGAGAREGMVYNPKDVPLGWDGKPIPYWMYKLHGLNHEFRCEICGNATYKGPRAFERHFTEGQHVQGLRCLGIGYSKAFMMITKIQDAVNLHDKLKRESVEARFDEDVEMEFEDQEGNVLNKKTYSDLLRQGLL